MNIFIMILVAIFMAGFYMMGAPSGHDARHTTENAVATSDLRTVAECAVATHNATIRGMEFDDICVQQNSIVSRMICLNNNLSVTKCEVVRNKKPAYTYIVTATAPIASDRYNDMMEIMEEKYADAGTFGIFQDGTIISGGTANRRIVPKGVISDINMENGMLVYLTQYEIPDTEIEYATPDEYDLQCPAGTV
ncbi:hypothetical protein HDR66_02020, partial [bacterium]|nr:hypothetical protein [bacterium]